MAASDPYDIEAVKSACARHAWQRREEELKSHGFNSETEVKNHIDKVVESQDTRAFVCQPQLADGKKVLSDQAFQREVYSAPFDSPKAHKDYATVVILNPNPDKNGDLSGGTLMIRDTKEFQRLEKEETRVTGVPPLVLEGGRPALLEQQQQQQQLAKFEDPKQQHQPPAPAPEHRPERPKLSFYEDDQQPKNEHKIKL